MSDQMCRNGHDSRHRRELPSGKRICVECRRESDRRRDERDRVKRRQAARDRHRKVVAGETARESPECAHPGCDRDARGQGFCDRHYARVRRHGSPDVVLQGGAPRDDDPSYTAVHLRIKRTRGSASAHRCVECGRQAEAWAYDRADPNEVSDGKRTYSQDESHYQPMCTRCHNRLDRRYRKDAA